MFVSDNSPLIRNSYRDLCGFFQDDTLTTQPALQPRVDGAVDEIFFLVRYFFQEFFPFFHVQVAGGTRADAPAIVIEVHVVLFRQFQNGHVHKIAGHCFRRYVGIFELKCNFSHGLLCLQEGCKGNLLRVQTLQSGEGFLK